jgi:hypothetical protein
LGNVAEAYQEVARRLGILAPENNFKKIKRTTKSRPKKKKK